MKKILITVFAVLFAGNAFADMPSQVSDPTVDPDFQFGERVKKYNAIQVHFDERWSKWEVRTNGYSQHDLVVYTDGLIYISLQDDNIDLPSVEGAWWNKFEGGSGGGDALTTNPLSQFASTTSLQLAGVISNETGTGLVVFGTDPTLTTPNITLPDTVPSIGPGHITYDSVNDRIRIYDGASVDNYSSDDAMANISMIDATGFNGNLATTDDTIQEVSQALDDLAISGAPEGTAVLSTGETGAVKYLREDGDGTSSWQTPSGSGDITAVTAGTGLTGGGTTGDVTLNANFASDAETITGTETAKSVTPAGFAAGVVDAFGSKSLYMNLNEDSIWWTSDQTTNYMTHLEGIFAPIASPTFTGTVSGISATMVGLGNVDNTSDTSKPVSTAQQTEIDTKPDSVATTIFVLDDCSTASTPATNDLCFEY